tara:strand:- start:577 stop:795 length:219 start_codon:yes stop_codon:yes gene_type:complete
MIFRTHGLPKLRTLLLARCVSSVISIQTMCEGLGFGSLPSLRTLQLAINQFGPAGAEALAAALGRGATVLFQ